MLAASSTDLWIGVLISLASGGLIAGIAAVMRGTFHAGQDAERFRDAERRLYRLEHHAGFYDRDRGRDRDRDDEED